MDGVDSEFQEFGISRLEVSPAPAVTADDNARNAHCTSVVDIVDVIWSATVTHV